MSTATYAPTFDQGPSAVFRTADRGRRRASCSVRCSTWRSFDAPLEGGDVMGSNRIRRIALGCVTGLLLSCATPQSPALKPIDPAALQTTVDATAKELLVPGAVVILPTPQGKFTVTYGTTTLGATIPPRADTHFRIASNTKTMTAAVIVQLAQEGRLALEQPASDSVCGVPDGDQITIADLLKMRSGLYNYTDAPEIS